MLSTACNCRAVVASTVGSVIESYDFLLYVLIAPLVFLNNL